MDKIVINGEVLNLCEDSSSNIYSTEETRIGTWIDERPLYRKVFTGKSPSSGGTTIIGYCPSDYDIGFVTGFAIYTNGSTIQIPYIQSDDDYISVYIDGSKRIVITVKETVNATYHNRDCYVFLTYVKTTDSINKSFSSEPSLKHLGSDRSIFAVASDAETMDEMGNL